MQTSIKKFKDAVNTAIDNYIQGTQSVPHNLEYIARVCHEVNKSYCESIGDYSQVSWDEVPQWQKDSAKDGVIHVINHPHTTSESLHEAWCYAKVKAGWSYGIIKDPINKTHPCIVSLQILT